MAEHSPKFEDLLEYQKEVLKRGETLLINKEGTARLSKTVGMMTKTFSGW